MQVLAFSDIHLDATTAGRERRKEVIDFLAQAFRLASEHRADLVVFAGDVHDPGGLFDPMYSSDAIRILSSYAAASWNPVFVAVAGNHDVVSTSELYLGAPLTTLTPMRIATQLLGNAEVATRMHVFDMPLTRRINNDWAVLGLPYVSRAHSDRIAAWEANAFDCAKHYVEKGMKLIVVGHRVVPGAEISSETTEMAKGQDQLLPVEAIAALKPALVINGHYHARQMVDVGKLRVMIPGSPLSFTFGEAEQVQKGVLLVRLD